MAPSQLWLMEMPSGYQGHKVNGCLPKHFRKTFSLEGSRILAGQQIFQLLHHERYIDVFSGVDGAWNKICSEADGFPMIMS